MKSKRRALSIVEAIVSITLVGLFLGLILLPSSRELKRREFSFKMAQLTQSARLARQLAFNCGATVRLNFMMEPGGVLTLSVECDDVLKRASPSIKKKLRLEGVEAIKRGKETLENLTISYIARGESPSNNSALCIQSKFYKKPISLGLE